MIQIPRLVHELKRNSSGIMFSLWWQETPYDSMKLCISPNSPFYTLLCDTLPFRKNRTLNKLVEELEDCLETMGYDIEMKNVDPEGYTALFSRDDIMVSLVNMYKLAQFGVEDREKIFTGSVNIEITIEAPEIVEVLISFHSDDVDLSTSYVNQSHVLNHLTFDQICFCADDTQTIV